MHPAALLDTCAELLRAVLKFDAPADATVQAFWRSHRNLGPRERHVLAETVFAVLRRRLLLEHLAQNGADGGQAPGPERGLTILAWQGDPAALRRALSPPEQHWLDSARAVDAEALPEALRHNLPDWIASPLHERLGDQFWPLVQAMHAPAPLDLRVNVLKARRDAVAARLRDAGIETERTPYSPWGLRVHGKPALSRLASFDSGEFEVQDEGSQLLALLVQARRGETVVDFCAGAGGKTLALGAAMRNTGHLYALDVSAARLDALRPRLVRSGLTNVYPLLVAHERDRRIGRLAGKADRVLVDAPCSGLGSLRRNPDLKWRQSPQAIEQVRARQRDILNGAARLVKPGGLLAYATCSLLEAENEQVAAEFAQDQPEFEPLSALQAVAAATGLTPSDFGRNAGGFLQLWPHVHKTDGFFAALWQRR